MYCDVEPPLRHGFCGDTEKREKVLRERVLDEEEIKFFPEKLGKADDHMVTEADKYFIDDDIVGWD